jgi:hypothetical protein
MPPSGSKPTSVAGNGWGFHEFHFRLRRFELKDGGSIYLSAINGYRRVRIFLVMLPMCGGPATI